MQGVIAGPKNARAKDRRGARTGMSGAPVKTIYRSNAVAIPDDFLRRDPADAQPITHQTIDFAASVLPEYAGLYAAILDHVLSPSECAQIIQLAEDSVMEQDREADGSPWRPALVNVGGGYEVEIPDYRKSGRIIWDSQEIVDRLWGRLAALPEIRESLSTLPPSAVDASVDPTKYEFYRVNKRLRFLKYTPGEFFRPHCDGPYGERTSDGHFVQTYITVHLYLNDSQQIAGPDVDLAGGATSFLSRDESRKLNVNPKAGRVLLFQHARLRHSGDDVTAGTKYTVRTDIMYKEPIRFDKGKSSPKDPETA
ncbi:oxidoreductase domain-containing protein [Nemania sp. NC0429]|nr:oxidoreductase domain-containing protein [Nemania sp. NC0429]